MEPKPKSPLVSAPASPALAFSLSGRICSACLSAQLTTRPLITRFSLAAETLIRAIHSIPALYPRAHLSQLLFYLGRSGNSAKHVSDRWRAHAAERERGHDYGMVLFRASTPRVLAWERLANRALRLLADDLRLRIDNVAPDGRGPAPSTEHSCIYLTWELCPPRLLLTPRGQDRPMHRALTDALDDALSPADTARSVAAITRPASRPLPVAWSSDSCTHALSA